MWERFTDHAKSVVAKSAELSMQSSFSGVRGEDLLSAMCCEPGCVAARALQNLGTNIESVSGEASISVSIVAGLAGARFSLRAKRILEGAVSEARALDHSYIGTEHILLSLLAYDISKEKPGFLARLFGRTTPTQAARDTDFDSQRRKLPSYEETRIEIRRLLGESGRNPA